MAKNPHCSEPDSSEKQFKSGAVKHCPMITYNSIKMSKTLHTRQKERDQTYRTLCNVDILCPGYHAVGASQPGRQTPFKQTWLCLDALMFIRLSATRAASIFLQDPLVAEKAEPETTQARQEARVCLVQILVTYGA